jgi:hypothetical protein
MYRKWTVSPDHTIAKSVTVPPLLGGCTTTRLRAAVLCLPVNVIEERLTSVHIFRKIVVPVVLHVSSPQRTTRAIKGVTLVNLAPVHRTLLVWSAAITFPMPFPFA